MHSDNEMVNLRSVIETLCYMVDDDSDGVEEIMQLPTIDLVRCKDCKYWKEGKCWNLKGLNKTDGIVNADDFCSYGERSEKPNNCEHITEYGVTCAKYPACDDCLDNPLNKVKGSERLVKGSEQTEREGE